MHAVMCNRRYDIHPGFRSLVWNIALLVCRTLFKDLLSLRQVEPVLRRHEKELVFSVHCSGSFRLVYDHISPLSFPRIPACIWHVIT
jgi:hypothetical protein